MQSTHTRTREPARCSGRYWYHGPGDDRGAVHEEASDLVPKHGALGEERDVERPRCVEEKVGRHRAGEDLGTKS